MVTDEDLSFYEGAGEGPNVKKVKEALNKEAMKNELQNRSDKRPRRLTSKS